MSFDTIHKKPIYKNINLAPPPNELAFNSPPVSARVFLKKKAKISLIIFGTSFTMIAILAFVFFNANALKKQVNFNAQSNIEAHEARSQEVAPAQTESIPGETVAGVATALQPRRAANSSHVLGNYYIEIPKLNVFGNILESSSMGQVESLLNRGIVRLPGSVNPGENGNLMLIGHSSSLQSGYYSKIFATLNRLQNNDLVIINKNNVSFVYKVYDKAIIEPKMELIKPANGEEKLALVTCWPIGSDKERLIIYAKRLR